MLSLIRGVLVAWTVIVGCDDELLLVLLAAEAVRASTSMDRLWLMRFTLA